MVRTCPSCGANTAPEARFCRHCGAPLRMSATIGEGEPISPLAQTVPLSSEGLTTSGLSTDEPGGAASDTRRVRRAEMENLLRRAPFDVAPADSKDGDGDGVANSDYAAPPTGELIDKTPAPAAVVVSAPAQTSERAANVKRPRRSWTLITGLLLLATLSGVLLAYYLLRQRTTENAGDAPAPASNSNQATAQATEQPTETPNTNSSVEETGTSAVEPQPEESPAAPTPKPSASVESSRDARARQERERALETQSPSATPTPAPTATPAAQTTQTPAPSPATVNGNSNGTTAPPQASGDSFYFQAVNIINGRDPRSLQRAELLRALQLFQNVRSGPHVAEASRQAERLGRELDRRNKTARP